MTKLILLAAMLASAAPATAQTMPVSATAAPVCPRDAEAIPPTLAAWRVKVPLSAARDEASLATATAQVGTAYDVSLAPSATVAYRVRPTRPDAPNRHGGMVRFFVRNAGTYRVAIGAGAWLDVVSGGTTIASVGHGHGPACSGIRKTVDFALKPGGYTLQIVGNAEATLPLLIAPAG